MYERMGIGGSIRRLEEKSEKRASSLFFLGAFPYDEEENIQPSMINFQWEKVF